MKLLIKLLKENIFCIFGKPKKYALVFLAFMVLTGGLHAQEKLYKEDVPHWMLSFGGGVSDILAARSLDEGTFSLGVVFDPRINLKYGLMLGSKNWLSFASDGVITLETQAYLRWNFLRLHTKASRNQPLPNTVNLFIQGGVGLLGSLRGPDDYTGPEGTEIPNYQKTRASMLFDGTFGITIPLGSKWNIEASGRGGYPFIWGAALTAGYKFPLQQRTVIQEGPERIEYRDRVEYQDRIEYQDRVEYQDRIEYRDRVEYQDRIEYRDRVVEVEITNEIIRRILITQIEYVLFGPNISRFNAGVDADARSLNELVINHIAQLLKGEPSLRVRIEGNANPVTHAPDEIQELAALSENRANEIARLLRKMGVSDKQIIVVALGGTRVVTREYDRQNMNRRVELMVIQSDVN